MFTSKSKIRGNWKLTHVASDNQTIIQVYSFPDNFMNSFFDAVNGGACQPTGDWDEAKLKWGYGTAAVDLDQPYIQVPAVYSSSRWPDISLLDSTPQRRASFEGQVYFSCGKIEYSPEDRLLKKSNFFNEGYTRYDGSPIYKFFILTSSMVTSPLTELGIAFDYNYALSYFNLHSHNVEEQFENYSFIESTDYIRNTSNNIVSTRSLVLDKNGNPTSITLQTGETIRVEYFTELEIEIQENQRLFTPTKRLSDGSLSDEFPTIVDVEMYHVLNDNNFVKNAPIGPLFSVWWPQSWSVYNSENQLIQFDDRGDLEDTDWITAGWDYINKNWGNMQIHSFNESDRWTNNNPLVFDNVTTKDISKIVIHDVGAVNTPSEYDNNVLATISFSPALTFSVDRPKLDFGYRVKRHLSANTPDIYKGAYDVAVDYIIGEGTSLEFRLVDLRQSSFKTNIETIYTHDDNISGNEFYFDGVFSDVTNPDDFYVTSFRTKWDIRIQYFGYDQVVVDEFYGMVVEAGEHPSGSNGFGYLPDSFGSGSQISTSFRVYKEEVDGSWSLLVETRKSTLEMGVNIDV